MIFLTYKNDKRIKTCISLLVSIRINHFQIITYRPNYPQCHGVEKTVGITKNMHKKAHEENKDFELYLLNYRNSSVANLKYSPSQPLCNRIFRSKIPINNNNLKPININRDAIYKNMVTKCKT